MGITTYSIQKKNSDGSYSTVYTDDVDHLASNTVSYTYSKTYSGTSGSTYRAVVKFYCKIGSGSATATLTSVSVTAK